LKTIINISFFLFFLGYSFNGFSQEKLRKFIFDKEQQTTIPFVNIYIKDGKKGWVSDANGYFEINSQDIKPTDVLVFSAIGYQEKTELFFKIKDSTHISMLPKTFTLNEVKIKTRRYKKGYLGKRKKSANNKWNDGLRNRKNSFISYEDAIFIPNHLDAEGIINDIRIYVRNGSETPFKIQLYTNNILKGIPEKPILKQPLLAKETEDRKWLIIPLKYENLSIPKDGFYIGVSWNVDSIYFAPYDTLIRTLNYTEPPLTRIDTIISRGVVLGEAFLYSKNRYSRRDSRDWEKSYNHPHIQSSEHKNMRYQTLAIYATILYDKASKQNQEDIFDNNGIVPQKLAKKIIKKKHKKVKKNTIKYPQQDITALFKSIKKAEDSGRINYALYHLYFYDYDELETLSELDLKNTVCSQSFDFNKIIDNPDKIIITEIETGLYSFVFDNRIYSKLLLTKGEWKLSPTLDIRE
jgi:hypothetical protein